MDKTVNYLNLYNSIQIPGHGGRALSGEDQVMAPVDDLLEAAINSQVYCKDSIDFTVTDIGT